MIGAKADGLTSLGAGAAVVSPWWLPFLDWLHDGAEWALPILGGTWLLVQIGFKFHEWWRMVRS